MLVNVNSKEEANKKDVRVIPRLVEEANVGAGATLLVEEVIFTGNDAARREALQEDGEGAGADAH